MESPVPVTPVKSGAWSPTSNMEMIWFVKVAQIYYMISDYGDWRSERYFSRRLTIPWLNRIFPCMCISVFHPVTLSMVTSICKKRRAAISSTGGFLNPPFCCDIAMEIFNACFRVDLEIRQTALISVFRGWLVIKDWSCHISMIHKNIKNTYISA